MLQQFLDEYARREWDWATTNCCLAAADWIVANGRSDPASELRGSFATEADCRALIVGAGGVVHLFGDAVEAIGLTTGAPVAGSVGVIGSANNVHRQWAAIYDGQRWQVRLQSGFVPFVARPLRVWSV
jgi:hypothetical protein